MNIFEKFKKTVNKYNLISDKDKILVSISGGQDSVCLAYLLSDLKKEKNFSFSLIYINHNLREKEVKKEEEFVRKLGSDLGVNVFLESIAVKEYAQENKLNLQEAARILRYKLLEEKAKSLNYNKIALGHTETDIVENFLFRLIRGSGLNGLGGISAVRKLTSGVIIIRPLIEITREETLNFLKENNYSYCLDSSNLKEIYQRNRIRLKLIPYLKKINPKIEKNLANLSQIIRDENSYWQELINKISSKIIIKEKKDYILIDYTKFLQYNVCIQRRFLHYLLEKSASFKKVEEILKFINSAGRKRIKISSDLEIYKDKNFLFFRTPSFPLNFLIKIDVGKEIQIDNLGLKIKTRFVSQDKFFPGKDPWKVYFDADKIDLNSLILRSRKEGDRFQPLGMKGRKKVKDFLIDKKIPYFIKDKVLILESKNEILWILGLRQSEIAKVDSETKKILEIKINGTYCRDFVY